MTPDLSRDDGGQWLLLIAVIVSIGLAVLIVFLNQSALAGHSSAGSIMDFPKNDVRDVRSETVSEAYILGMQANQAPDINQRNTWFTNNFTQYMKDTKTIFGDKGAVFNVNYDVGSNASLPATEQQIQNLTLNMYYNNGDTMYNETTVVYLG
ncbi:MAG TPA: hypothetical protein VK436_08595 [Methanocella sp.]|nr:hypothetical protein [Methanocella sp.]